MHSKPKLVRDQHGVLSWVPMISEEAIQKFYADTYFQSDTPMYPKVKSDRELAYITTENAQILAEVQNLLQTLNAPKVLDIGCGEGFLLSLFHKNGFSITGIDYSTCGLQQQNPDMLPYVVQGDCTHLAASAEVNARAPFDVVIMTLTLECLREPHTALHNIHALMHQDSLLVIKYVNNFSDLQNFIRQETCPDYSPEVYPNHLHYYNKASMECTLEHCGYTPLLCHGGDIIEFDLLADESNYFLHKEVGKSAHRKRQRIKQFLYELSPEGTLQLARAFGQMGVGRTLTVFVRQKEAL